MNACTVSFWALFMNAGKAEKKDGSTYTDAHAVLCFGGAITRKKPAVLDCHAQKSSCCPRLTRRRFGGRRTLKHVGSLRASRMGFRRGGRHSPSSFGLPSWAITTTTNEATEEYGK